MRTRLILLSTLAVVAAGLVGCSGPETKLGRGLSNTTEFARLGEIRRSMEQTALWDGAQTAYTTGFIRGFNRSLVRTGIGLYEVVTFPFPSYEPTMKPYATGNYSPKPVYPDNYKPGVVAGSTFQPDSSLGFGVGDVMPFSPGSRFHIFDY